MITDQSSPAVPSRGWALFQHAPPSRLGTRPRDFLVLLFQDGKTDRNLRCSPYTAQEKLREKFPDSQDCWLSVKQVKGESKFLGKFLGKCRILMTGNNVSGHYFRHLFPLPFFLCHNLSCKKRLR